jgi:hypothetical protein
MFRRFIFAKDYFSISEMLSVVTSVMRHRLVPLSGRWPASAIARRLHPMTHRGRRISAPRYKGLISRSWTASRPLGRFHQRMGDIPQRISSVPRSRWRNDKGSCPPHLYKIPITSRPAASRKHMPPMAGTTRDTRAVDTRHIAHQKRRRLRATHRVPERSIPYWTS